MRTARQLATFASLTRIALVLAALAGAGCFKPNVRDGGFKCADGGTPCPEGFLCDHNDGLCWKSLDGGAGKGGKGGGGVGGMAGAGGGAGASGMGGGGGQLPCFQPKAGCDPADGGDLCDPVCQSGCSGCRDKCSVNTAGALTCAPPTRTKLAGPLEACSISNPGTATQADDCAPGSVCVDVDVCFPRCFVFCRSDQDCPGALCERAISGSSQRACSIPFNDTCTPLGGSANTGCGVAMACYLAASHPEHTYCDCPQSDGREGDDCARSRDCNPGLACTYLPNDGKATCRRVCDLTLNGTDCGSSGGSCRAYPGASGTNPTIMSNMRWGFCI
jgi:hypothetical protein